jgi:hypothetical protein
MSGARGPPSHSKRRPNQRTRHQDADRQADGAQTTEAATAEKRADKLGPLLDSLETVLMKVRHCHVAGWAKPTGLMNVSSRLWSRSNVGDVECSGCEAPPSQLFYTTPPVNPVLPAHSLGFWSLHTRIGVRLRSFTTHKMVKMVGSISAAHPWCVSMCGCMFPPAAVLPSPG